MAIGKEKAFEVLMEAQQHYHNMSRFRQDRERNKRYTYGDQWKDMVVVDGEEMSEEEYIKRQGSVPLKNNLIRRLIRNILGVYRNQSKEPVCTARDRDEQKIGETMSVVLQCNMQLNRMNEVYARSMEEFLISGFVVHRKWYGWRNDKLDCWTDYVQPNNFFIDSNMRDFRGWDVACCGEIHDISFESLCREFARSQADYKRLADIYRMAQDKPTFHTTWESFGFSRNVDEDFFVARDPSRCRVIEVWRRESKPRYRCHDYNNGDVFKVDIADYAELVEGVNAERLARGLEAGMPTEKIPLIKSEWFMDDCWVYYFLTPFGDVLDSGETPYEHKSHPYVFKAYPFIDGEIHSFVSDIIDQQRYTNRLITLYDWIMRSSAKGVLIIPEDSLKGTDLKLEDVADVWSSFNGVLALKLKDGTPMPQQIHANSTNVGINELLQLQLKFFEDISGVHGALQGKPGYSGMSGTLYAQQTQNATTSLLDMLDSFGGFVIDAAYKDVKNMQQFYDSKRVFNIAGRSGQTIVLDPNKIQDVEFDLSIIEGAASPAYRQIGNEFLLEIWRAGQITLEQLLQNGDFPFADELLQSIQSQKEQIEQGQAPEGVPEELMRQAQAQGQLSEEQLQAIQGATK